MTIIFPVVRCASQQRSHRSGKPSDSAAVQEGPPFNSDSTGNTNVKDEVCDEDEGILGGAARDAKERLAERLRLRRRSSGGGCVSVGERLGSALAAQFRRCGTCFAYSSRLRQHPEDYSQNQS